MKSILNKGLIVLLILACLYILFLRECRTEKQIAPDEMIIKKSVWDSIVSIANKPPIIQVDTVRIKGDVVYVTNKPLPNPEVVDTARHINVYKDSLINAEINVSVRDSVKGVLLARSWEYKPTVTKITETKTIFVPKIVNNEVAVSKNGMYIYGMVGGNSSTFAPGAGIDFITKKNTEVGAVYQRCYNTNIFSVKLGFKLGR